MGRFATLAVIGALSLASLSACSEEDSAADYCGTSKTLAWIGGMTALFPSEGILEQAKAGDMTGLHAWGASKSDTFAARMSELERAKADAPTDEAARALDVLIAQVGPMEAIYSAARTAPKVEAFFDALDALPIPDEASDAAGMAAVDVLAKTDTEFCQ